MKNQKTLKCLREMYKHCEFYNSMAPFPVYDTDYVKDIKQIINKMEKAKEDYDSLPVAACRHCKSLHIVSDELENDVCARCGSKNDIEIYTNIDFYLKNKAKSE